MDQREFKHYILEYENFIENAEAENYIGLKEEEPYWLYVRVILQERWDELTDEQKATVKKLDKWLYEVARKVDLSEFSFYPEYWFSDFKGIFSGKIPFPWEENFAKNNK